MFLAPLRVHHAANSWYVSAVETDEQCEATGTRTGNSKERKIHFKHKYFPLITSQLQNMDCGCRDGITMKCWYEVNDRDKGAIKKDIGCRNPEPQCK